MHPVDRLQALSRSFGRGAARQKLQLLEELDGAERLPVRKLAVLHDLLCFMRAYPDGEGVLERVVEVGGSLRERVGELPDGEETAALADSGFPGAVNRHPFSYPTVRRLLTSFPGCCDVVFDELEEQCALHNALVLFVTNNECQGLDDIRLTMDEWAAGSQGDRSLSNLEHLVAIFEGSGLPLEQRAFVYDQCGIPVRYHLAEPGTGRCELAWEVDEIRFQRREISRAQPRLAREIARPLPRLRLLTPARGERLIRLADAALCSRLLEIAPLMYANPADATLVECGHGLRVALIGVVPEYRDTLESAYFFLILKNGVPIGYGPASVCLGCCEMGINLFPEFRGAEIRTIYAQFMRSLHQVLGVRYFYLTSYGMGEGNPAAIRTGAFWFYRKLGFRATNPEVEALARREEQKMAADAAYRSDVKTLRALSHTYAYFDISEGTCLPLDLGAIGMRQSRFIAERFGGDRRRALRSSVAQVRRLLGVRSIRGWTIPERRALELYAPLLAMVPELPRWSARDKRALLRVIRSKGARSERAVDQLASRHARLSQALRELAG